MISSNQLKALIRNKSISLEVKPNIILRSVIFEFFLEKLALSKYSNQFIIKGGFLVSAITNINLRTTMDLDVTLKSLKLSKDTLSNVLIDIISIHTHDLLIMELINIVEIKDNGDYPGLRANLKVLFDGIKESIKIDFTTGDILTPKEINFNYRALLNDNQIKLKSYNFETLLAEKLETILSRGVLNTRMRDYYDVYIIFQLKEINMSLLKEAFLNTSKSRNTFEQISLNIQTKLNNLHNSQNLKILWSLYQKNYSYASDVAWDDVFNVLKYALEAIDTCDKD